MLKSTNLKTTTYAFLLAILSGIFIYFAWPANGIYFLLFTGFVPLFFGLDLITSHRTWVKAVLIVLVFFAAHFTWIACSMHWLQQTTAKTYFVGITIESLAYSLPFVLLIWIEKLSKLLYWIFIVCLWMIIEYLNQNWLLGTPYFTLGNGLGMSPNLIQSYEYIGIEGASLFILLCNIGCYLLIKNIRSKQALKFPILTLAIGISPFIISALLMTKHEEKNLKSLDNITISMLHTDIKPFTLENHAHPEKVIEQLWQLSQKTKNSKAELMIWPETIIANLGWLSNQENDVTYQTFQKILSEQKNNSFCVGGYAFSVDFNGSENPYAQYDEKRNFYYQTHNIAATYRFNELPQIRSKEIFVPFQERIPYLKSMPFMAKFADVVGANTMVSFFENGLEIHTTANNHRFTPILCYESVFPLKMAQKAEEIDFYAVLANEHWNPSMDGSMQYLYNGVAMAIQSRIPIFRSSNSGITALIDKYGTIISTRKGNDIGVITCSASPKTESTFYESIAGFFYNLSLLVASSILLLSFFKKRIVPVH